MKTLVINLHERLSPLNWLKLGGIIGAFTERRPTVGGKSLWLYARDLVNADLSPEELKTQMDDFFRRCYISDKQWRNPVLVIHGTSSTAGQDIANDLILDAVARRKGGPVDHMMFGNGQLCHDHPYSWPTPEERLADEQRRRLAHAK